MPHPNDVATRPDPTTSAVALMARPDWAARSLEGQAVVASVVRVLAPLGISVMPLKGILMDALEPAMIGTRDVGDVDVLVTHHSAALAALYRIGWRLVSSAAHATTLAAPNSALYLDLHREVTSTVACQLTAELLFRRGTADRLRFGAPVVLPNPLDEFAHLVAHFTQSRATSADTRHVADFARVARRAALDPASVARHLDELGLGRAARYALRAAVDVGDGFSATVLAALAPDLLGDVLARLAAIGLSRFPVPTKPGALFPPLLARSLPRGAAVLTLRIVAAATQRASTESAPKE